MVASGIEVCNMALVELGANVITSFEESSSVAEQLRLTYPKIKRSIMSSYPWECLKVRKELTRTAVKPIGYKYQFTLPGDKLSGVIAAFPNENFHERGITDFEIMGGNVLVTNHPRIIIDYVADMPEDRWPPFFTDLVYTAVGARIAYTITDSQSTASDWQQRAFGTPSEGGQGGLYGLAKTLDAQGSGNAPGLSDEAFVNARLGGWS